MKTTKLRYAALLLAAFGLAGAACTASPTSESTGQYIDSTVVATKVRAAIANDPQVSIFDIDVTTFKDTVQLSGFVNTQAEKEQAGRVAASVKGVADVRNNIVVKPR